MLKFLCKTVGRMPTAIGLYTNITDFKVISL